MSGGDGVGVGKSSSDLSDGVGIGIRVSRSLAIRVDAVSSSISVSRGHIRVGSIGMVDKSVGVGNVSGVVGMSGGDGVGVGKSSSDLSDGVGIGIRVSRSLAIRVDAVSSIDGGGMTSISKMSRVEAIAVANSGDDSRLTIIERLEGRNSSGYLTKGVSIGISGS